MKLLIWTRNDETGLLDDEFRDGDVFLVGDDSMPIGNQEKKSWLAIKIPNPPNMEKVMEEFQRSEYASGRSLGDDPVVRRKRIFTLDWRSKFTASDIERIEKAQGLPDGNDVVDGIVINKFTIKDFSRK